MKAFILAGKKNYFLKGCGRNMIFEKIYTPTWNLKINKELPLK